MNTSRGGQGIIMMMIDRGERRQAGWNHHLSTKRGKVEPAIQSIIVMNLDRGGSVVRLNTNRQKRAVEIQSIVIIVLVDRGGRNRNVRLRENTGKGKGVSIRNARVNPHRGIPNDTAVIVVGKMLEIARNEVQVTGGIEIKVQVTGVGKARIVRVAVVTKVVDVPKVEINGIEMKAETNGIIEEMKEERAMQMMAERGAVLLLRIAPRSVLKVESIEPRVITVLIFERGVIKVLLLRVKSVRTNVPVARR